jgi:hypothetical protein
MKLVPTASSRLHHLRWARRPVNRFLPPSCSRSLDTKPGKPTEARPKIKPPRARARVCRPAVSFALAAAATGGPDEPFVFATERLQPTSAIRTFQHTVRYSELAPTRFKNFWRD